MTTRIRLQVHWSQNYRRKLKKICLNFEKITTQIPVASISEHSNFLLLNVACQFFSNLSQSVFGCPSKYTLTCDIQIRLKCGLKFLKKIWQP